LIFFAIKTNICGKYIKNLPLEDGFIQDFLTKDLKYKNSVKGIPSRLSFNWRIRMSIESMSRKQLETKFKRVQNELDELKKWKKEQTKSIQSLQEEENKWRSLIGNAPNFIIIVDRKGTLQFINHTVPGLKKEEVIGSNHYDYIDKEYHQVVKKTINKVFRTGEPDSYKVEGVGPDDTVSWYEANVGPIKVDGHVKQVSIIATDITEKVEAEKALKESEEKYKLISENTSDYIAICDLDGNFQYVSPSHINIGWKPEEMMGTSGYELIHPEDLDRLFPLLEGALSDEETTKSSEVIEFRAKAKDGSWHPWESTVNLVKDDSGGGSLLFISRDVSERRRNEQALIESEEKFRMIFENAGEGLIFIDIDGNIGDINPKACKIAGLKCEELRGKNVMNLFEAFQLDPDEMEKVFKHLVSGEPYEEKNEWEIINKDGENITILANHSLVKKDGEVVGLSVIIEDITDRKLAEQGLKESEKMYRLLAENAIEVIWTMDMDLNFTYISPSVEQLRGYSAEEAMKLSLEESFTPQSYDYAMCELSMELAKPPKKRPLSRIVEIEQNCKDGSTVWTEVTIRMVNDEKGEMIGLQGTTRDITERREAETALRESEAKYSALVEETTDIIVIFQEGVIRFINRASKDLIGYRPDELIGKGFQDLVAPEFLNLVAERYKARMGGKKVPKIYELIVMKKDKTKVPVEVNASLIDYQGKPADLVIIRDITERKKMEEEIKKHRDHLEELVKERTRELTNTNKKLQKQITQREKAEQALKENEERLRAILSSLHDTIVLVVDKDSKHLFVSGSSEMETRYGIKSKEFLGKTFRDIFTSEEAELRIQGIQAIFETGMSMRDELIFDTPKGQFWHDMSLAPLMDEDGNVTAVVGVSRDITDRKKVEKEIKRSEEKYRNLFENSLVGMFRLSMKDGALIEANNTFKDMLGLKTLKDVMVWDIFAILEDKEAIHYHIREGGGLVNFETQFKRADGSLFWASVNAKQFPKDGFIEGVIIDITEKKKLEEEIQKMNKLESLGILAGGIAHDFNNVLTAIMGNISLAKSYSVSDEKVFKKLDEAERASMQARELSQKLITFSKGGKPIKKTGSVKDLILESVDLVISGKDVVADMAIPEDLLPVEIDQSQMSQVLNNLLINAQQAMPKGGSVSITARNTKIRKRDALPLETGDYIKVSISDTGTGIAKKDLPNIFDPFYSTKPDGSGLGLTTCYSIVKAHGGHITVESKMGKGTTFHIYLPITKKTQKAKDRKTKRRILIMDDERTIRDVLAEMLSDHGYYVETAVSGEEAIELYRSAKKKRKPFHLVIMDLVIAHGMGGKETILELKEFDPKIKAVVSSGYSEDSLMADYKDHGFLAVISKPYKIADLLQTIEDVIEKK
jgi:PAS domain S-box-containing protein